jgi:phosphoribosylformylglycinamidine synthase
VHEAARNVACAGVEPNWLTDCLNFGNPEKGEIAWELAEAIEGMALAAEALGVPVVSGNVSLYNETDGRAIPPTPVVGCVGLVPDVRVVPSRWREGDVVLVAGAVGPTIDLTAEARLIEFLWRAAPLLSLAHDVSDDGLDVALAEAALWSGVGAEVDLPAAGGTVIACAPSEVERLGGVPLLEIGVVGGDRLLGFRLDELGKAAR